MCVLLALRCTRAFELRFGPGFAAIDCYIASVYVMIKAYDRVIESGR